MTFQSRKDTAYTNFNQSNELIQIYNAISVNNVNEAIAVLFHSFLLEVGFIPQDVSNADIYKLMPKDWNANGIFKIKYFHICCPSLTCCVTCVPLYKNVSVHGIICDTVCSESVDFMLDIGKYLKQKEDLSNICEVFNNIDELSRYFKDNFCLPLVNLLHENIGGKRLYGFPGLDDDCQIHLLMHLPVKSIASVSAVNKRLHNLANLPFLWKYLFKRDFAKNGVPEVETSSEASAEIDWKEKYKKEYVKRNRRPELRHFILPYNPFPRIFSMVPELDNDFDIHLDPPFPAFYRPSLNELPRTFHLPKPYHRSLY